MTSRKTNPFVQRSDVWEKLFLHKSSEASTDSTATEEAHDRRPDEVIAVNQKAGEAFFVGTT